MTTARRKRSRVALGFGEKLRSARHRCGLSQEQLATACDMDHPFPNFFERGQRTPVPLVLLDLAAAMEVPPERLVIDTAVRIEDG